MTTALAVAPAATFAMRAAQREASDTGNGSTNDNIINSKTAPIMDLRTNKSRWHFLLLLPCTETGPDGLSDSPITIMEAARHTGSSQIGGMPGSETTPRSFGRRGFFSSRGRFVRSPVVQFWGLLASAGMHVASSATVSCYASPIANETIHSDSVTVSPTAVAVLAVVYTSLGVALGVLGHVLYKMYYSWSTPTQTSPQMQSRFWVENGTTESVPMLEAHYGHGPSSGEATQRGESSVDDHTMRTQNSPSKEAATEAEKESPAPTNDSVPSGTGNSDVRGQNIQNSRIESEQPTQGSAASHSEPANASSNPQQSRGDETTLGKSSNSHCKRQKPVTGSDASQRTDVQRGCDLLPPSSSTSPITSIAPVATAVFVYFIIAYFVLWKAKWRPKLGSRVRF